MKGSAELIAFAREALGLSTSAEVGLVPLGGRGSDRSYFRIERDGAESCILVRYDPKRTENGYFAEIALFLRDIHIPVPAIIRHDPAACLILMEDLGEIDLWSLRNRPWETRTILYHETLVVVDRLHAFPAGHFPSGRVRLMEPFGRELYQWERGYFKDHFVEGLCRLRLDPAFGRALEEELSALAERLCATSACLVHRDLQSQNVMVHDEKPFLIDFQGMRFGSLFYDLGSLLCDPYVHFSEIERDELLLFYYGLSKRQQEWAEFRHHFWEASAQRLMQALGAYGFLGVNRGLAAYLEHVPAGMANLIQAAGCAGSLPRLSELCERCAKATGYCRGL